MKKPKRTEAEIMEEGIAASIAPRRVQIFGDEKKAEPEERRTMRVKMNTDITICVDGIHPSDFKAGDTVELPSQIAASLLEDNRASCVGAEAKALEGAPENKMLKGPKLNKGKRP